MNYVVGVDVGGTKTSVAAGPADDTTGDITLETVVSSSSWRSGLGDLRADATGLRSLLVRQFGEGVTAVPLAVGAHGCENTAQCHQLERELRRHFRGPVLVVNDSELMAPAMGLGRAIGVVVGTGSIATARDETGDLLTVGGWGWLLGDPGSAPGLVREATRAVLSQLDRGGDIDALGRRVMACFSVRDGAELALAVTECASAQAWGIHAPEVFAAVDDGSVLAEAVIAAAAEHLAAMIGLLLQRGVRARTAVAGGSVIERQPLLQAALRTAIARDVPGFDVQILARPPVAGAIVLAQRIARTPTTTPLKMEDATL